MTLPYSLSWFVGSATVSVTVGAGACSATICGNGPNAAPARGRGRGLSAVHALSHPPLGDRAVVHKQGSKSRAKSDEFLPRFHRVPQPDDAAVDTATATNSLASTTPPPPRRVRRRALRRSRSRARPRLQ